MSTLAYPVRLKARRPLWKEHLIKWLLFACAAVSIATTAAIIMILAKESFAFLTTPLESGARVGIGEFLFGTRWAPILVPQSFGVLPLACGTILVMVGAALISIPLGLATAIYLSEYAPERVRTIVKPILEILAGIPTVVYGYFALTFVTPKLQWLLDGVLKTMFGADAGVQVFNAASASIVVGIMTLPMVTSLCDDSLQAVPDSLRQGGYAMGATKFEVSMQVLIIFINFRKMMRYHTGSWIKLKINLPRRSIRHRHLMGIHCITDIRRVKSAFSR